MVGNKEATGVSTDCSDVQKDTTRARERKKNNPDLYKSLLAASPCTAIAAVLLWPQWKRSLLCKQLQCPHYMQLTFLKMLLFCCFFVPLLNSKFHFTKNYCTYFFLFKIVQPSYITTSRTSISSANVHLLRNSTSCMPTSACVFMCLKLANISQIFLWLHLWLKTSILTINGLCVLENFRS